MIPLFPVIFIILQQSAVETINNTARNSINCIGGVSSIETWIVDHRLESIKLICDNDKLVIGKAANLEVSFISTGGSYIMVEASPSGGLTDAWLSDGLARDNTVASCTRNLGITTIEIDEKSENGKSWISAIRVNYVNHKRVQLPITEQSLAAAAKIAPTSQQYQGNVQQPTQQNHVPQYQQQQPAASQHYQQQQQRKIYQGAPQSYHQQYSTRQSPPIAPQLYSGYRGPTMLAPTMQSPHANGLQVAQQPAFGVMLPQQYQQRQ